MYIIYELMGISINRLNYIGGRFMKNLLKIEYCTSWAYLGRAVALSRTLLKEHEDKITELALVPSHGGVYEITLNDELIFSKKELDRYPEKDEVEEMVREKLK